MARKSRCWTAHRWLRGSGPSLTQGAISALDVLYALYAGEDIIPLQDLVPRHDAMNNEGVFAHELLAGLERSENAHSPTAPIGERSDAEQLSACVEVIESCAVRREMLLRLGHRGGVGVVEENKLGCHGLPRSRA